MRSNDDPMVPGGGAPDTADAPSFIEAARRAQIVASAIRTIATQGYAQASLARIAAEAGISKGVISYHFAGKDALIAQVMADVSTLAGGFVRPRVLAAVEQGSAAMLRAFIEASVGFMAQHRDMVIALVEILTHARDSEGAPLGQPVGRRTQVEGLESLLRRGQRDGSFRPFAVPVMGNAILSALDGIAPMLACRRDLDLGVVAGELADAFDRATRRE